MNKKLILSALISSMFVPVLALAAQKSLVSYLSLDTEKGLTNTVSWDAKKIGGAHNGTVTISSAEVTLDSKKGITGGTVTMDMKTIASVDLEKDTTSKEKLETHLKSADFFDVEKNPTAVFTIKSVTGVKGKKGKVLIKGDLLMKGVSHGVNALATWKKNSDGKYSLVSDSFKLDRTQWGVKFGSSLLENVKDRFIEDMINLKVSLNLFIPKA